MKYHTLFFLKIEKDVEKFVVYCAVLIGTLRVNIVFFMANSADPAKMLQYVAFHLGVHCLQKYRYPE